MSIKHYPWQESLWTTLDAMQERLPHALLLHGRPGIGKFDFAKAFAISLLCENRTLERLACGSCPACTWFLAGNHPDFRLIQPEIMSSGLEEGEATDAGEEPKKKASKLIKIEQIRLLSDFLNVGSHRQGRRVVLIFPAESMNAGAANALLKNLEEPGAGVIFILVSHEPGRLLPTVRSRCQSMALATPPLDLSVQWLKKAGARVSPALLAYSGNAPLAALALSESELEGRDRLYALLSQPETPALKLADACQSVPPVSVVDWMLKWTYDMVALGSGAAVRYNIDRVEVLARLVRGVSVRALQRYFGALCALRAISEHPLNPRLFFDDLFIEYKEIRHS